MDNAAEARVTEVLCVLGGVDGTRRPSTVYTDHAPTRFIHLRWDALCAEGVEAEESQTARYSV